MINLLEWIDKPNFISIYISDFLRSIGKLSILEIKFDTCLCNRISIKNCNHFSHFKGKTIKVIISVTLPFTLLYFDRKMFPGVISNAISIRISKL